MFGLGAHANSEPASSPAPVSTAVDGWDFMLPPAQLTALCTSTLTRARTAFAAIENDTRPASLQRVFGAYDKMMISLEPIEHIWYLSAIHPDLQVQAAAEACINDYTDFSSSLRLSRNFYRRVAAIELTPLGRSERNMVEKRLRDFRKGGIDRDQLTRDRVKVLMSEIAELGAAFNKAIRGDRRYVEATPKQLRGMPQDFLDEHPADERGIIRISTDYPDYFPVMNYSADDKLRRALYIAKRNIATPTNSTTLKALIAKRHELANLLGYESHAALAMDGKMIGSPQNARQFLDEVGDAAKAAADQDMATLLARLRKIDPTAQEVQPWQAAYLANLVREENYAFSSREVRQYFRFDKVQAGIFQLVEDLFGVEIVPWRTATWHPDVTAWEMRENGVPIGRFYLDLHPRADKYSHAAHWTLRAGLRNRQLPVSGLATNFPQGLMEHDQVKTFLHEFGHLLHNMFSGTQQWVDISGMSMEWDFVEAPSQMLEEWIWDYDTLRRFASNKSGEMIPQALVEKMNAARRFRVAASTAGQIFLANLSLDYYSRNPDSFDLLPLLRKSQTQYALFPYVKGTHRYNSFGHLYGYSSNYYIYQWSKAIAIDMFSNFKRAGLHDKEVAMAFRQKVLARGGSRPAMESIADFLGRPYSTKTYTEFLYQLN